MGIGEINEDTEGGAGEDSHIYLYSDGIECSKTSIRVADSSPNI